VRYYEADECTFQILRRSLMTKNRWTLRLVIILALVASFLLSAYAPISGDPTVPASDLVRLVVRNKYDKPLALRLQAPGAYYYLQVEGESTATYTVLRGDYDYTLWGCGATSSGTMDLNKNRTLIMPICGGGVTNVPQNGKKLDLSTLIKIVPVTIENALDTHVLVIFTGASTYVFTFDKGQKKDYTIARGSYTVKYWACGAYVTRDFEANKNSSLVLTCGK
jgi:hypothetical protein